MTNILYWFRQDHRLSDNPALAQACTMAEHRSEPLLPVTLLPTEQTTDWGFTRLGEHRKAYEAQSLTALAGSLRSLGSDLHQPKTPGCEGLIELARQVNASCIVCESIHAPYEIDEIKTLTDAGIKVETIEQSALLPHDSLPFETSKTPTVFSDFRRQVEKAKSLPRTPLARPATLPPLPDGITGAVPYTAEIARPIRPTLDARSALPYQQEPWQGGEASGQAHLARYFASTLPGQYKVSRNGLIGTDYSTKFSPWLATGAVSAAQIWQALQHHEATYGGNDGTYWIWFELLWRDHFRLMMQRFGRRLFRYAGLAKPPHQMVNTPPKHNQQGFDRWRHGLTGHAFIDAGMRELAATGYLSHRMRQNVASYLIHDLGCDWRAGAAWFEHCLVDFDVHSNQGNWAYIAGVGTDPRGGRRFNPDKQAHDYDRDASYRNLWSAD
jgi:deoxyribodipyrimidine photo-lyase